MSESLAIKYRPSEFDDVVGQSAVVRSLKTIVNKRQSHSFLLTGPSGCGKTTLARIVARKVGCLSRDIMEVDAATRTGVDDMRSVQEGLRFKPLGKGSSKGVIVDECHMLSKAAWNSMLKIVEEPPEYVFFFFCTTEPGKVPQTIKTRCTAYSLKLLSDSELTKIVKQVCAEEDIKLKSDIVEIVVAEANGSARQALSNLTLVQGVKDTKEASAVLSSAAKSTEAIDLCRFLMKGGSWVSAMQIVDKMKDQNPESVRIIVCNYLAAVLKSAKNKGDALRALAMLDNFSTPYNPSEKQAPLLLSIGHCLFD